VPNRGSVFDANRAPAATYLPVISTRELSVQTLRSRVLRRMCAARLKAAAPNSDALSPADDLPLTTSATSGHLISCCARKIKLTNSIDYNPLLCANFWAAGFWWSGLRHVIKR